MANTGNGTAIPGSRALDLKNSFKLAVRSLLTACSKQEFIEAFSEFSGAEQERLHRLYIQVVASLHQSIEEEFETLCHETQVGSVLDTVEQDVEEQTLDPLFPDKTNVMDIANDLSAAKKKEIQRLTDLLQRVEEQNCSMEARVSLLKKQAQDFSGPADAVQKLKSGFLGYFTSNNNKQFQL